MDLLVTEKQFSILPDGLHFGKCFPVFSVLVLRAMLSNQTPD